MYEYLIPVLLYLFLVKNPPNSSVTITFGGDVMLGRTFRNLIDKYPNYPVYKFKKDTDLLIANLETSITNTNDKDPKTFNYRMKPEHIRLLKDFDFLSLANNHSLDFKVPGLKDTIKTLDDAKIKHSGAGLDLEQASKLAIIEKKNIKIGFLSAADHYKRWRVNDKPGIWYIDTEDPSSWDKVLEKIRQDKKKVDILIMSLHWGPNYRWEPSDNFRKFAHLLIDNGVNIIHGHSAHHVQEVEKYEKGLIMYSLGSYVDDYAVSPEYRNDLGLLVKLKINKSGEIKKIKYVPIKISKYSVDRAKNEDKKAVLRTLATLGSLRSHQQDQQYQ